MRHIFFFILVTAALAAVSQRTTRKGLRVEPVGQEAVAAESVTSVDTVSAPAPHTVDINGYDKPLRSRRETFFVTNNSDLPLSAIAVTIDYQDTRRRQLHRATHHIKADIPAGETRQLSLRSWDAQFAFYYELSAVPARAQQATPYKVAISVDTLFFEKH